MSRGLRAGLAGGLAVLASFPVGPALVRATVSRVRGWLCQAPPVIRELLGHDPGTGR